MKILQLVSNYHRVFPSSNHAIYSHVAWLVNGLITRGHRVSLFASGDSETNGQLFSVSPTATSQIKISENLRQNYFHLLASKCYAQSKDADIIHSHFNILNLFYSHLIDRPTVQCFHTPLTDDQKTILDNFKTNCFISFSLAQRKQMPSLNWSANIYHGVDTNLFLFNPDPQDYFLYLGRITEEKGVHFAIEAAKAANVPLIIVGRSYPAEGYWHKEIEPHIDGKMIRYVGEADFDKKREWLKNAKALLMPTQYDEIFGLVMIEAMSSGTPVIAFKKGSIPEVVAHKRTGYVVENAPEMIEAIKSIDKIKRQQCRKRAETLFSVEKMVNGYIKTYERIIDEHKHRQEKRSKLAIFSALMKHFKDN